MSFTDWFKSKRQLIEEKNKVSQIAAGMQEIIDSVNNTLALNILQKEQARNECLLIFGAAALQHNGELVIKPDFVKMFLDPEYKLQVAITNKDDGSISIVTTEVPAEAEEGTKDD